MLHLTSKFLPYFHCSLPFSLIYIKKYIATSIYKETTMKMYFMIEEKAKLASAVLNQLWEGKKLSVVLAFTGIPSFSKNISLLCLIILFKSGCWYFTNNRFLLFCSCGTLSSQGESRKKSGSAANWCHSWCNCHVYHKKFWKGQQK